MIKNSLILALLLWHFPAVEAHAEETIYPAGHNFVCQYDVSDTIITAFDTVLITRSLANNDTFSIAGLYFSENIPPHFTIVSYSIRENGEEIEHLFQDENDHSVVDGCTTYYWVVDEPGALATVENDVNPGEHVDLELKLVCNSAGVYILPLHTTVFYGGGSGYFSTGDQVTIRVEYQPLCGDADGSGGINILDVACLINFLYRDGPPPVHPELGDTDASGNINILDVTCLVNYLYKDGPEPVCP
ncbi:MAG: hypothetical protein JSU69_06655 [Candidatus Zixiibacteriota bacterium]|nr:MAG: hypothetical protein JSU69_06655 [candidate division Zixibacteria bacterium]